MKKLGVRVCTVAAILPRGMDAAFMRHLSKSVVAIGGDSNAIRKNNAGASALITNNGIEVSILF